MKRAVITTGGKQYLVGEGDIIDVELLGEGKNVSFEALLVIDGDKTTIGAPNVTGVTVKAEVVAQKVAADKVTSIRYKAKKRVKKVHGHRQKHTQLKITSIA